MRKIEILPGVFASALGFGCAPILGSVGGHDAKRAIMIALDNGINHFDLARSYGYGEAEKFVGALLKEQRKNVVIATKFGIMANWKARLLRPLKPIIRNFKKANSNQIASQKIVNADYFHDRININRVNLVNSLDSSLRALSSDYVDILFIHEPVEKINNFEDILEEALLQKQLGKIRGLGLACNLSELQLHESYLDSFNVIQCNLSPYVNGYDTFKKRRSNDSNIFFSPIRGGDTKMSVDAKFKTLQVDFPQSIVLCSMFNAEHIVSNARQFN